jgi:hypothetical protein
MKKARMGRMLSAVRRVERVFPPPGRLVVAMTFDDGPTASPARPGNGKRLTESLLDTMKTYGARGTFDVIGSTAPNYPDREGRPGTALWSGVIYDHYPLFGQDSLAGVANQRDLARRILDEGHELTNHGNTHVDEIGTLVDSYQIVLNTPLSGRVTIVATPHSSLDLGAGPGVPITQTFTPADWNVPQTIFVRAFDNLIPQGPHTADIKHTAFSSDGSYNWNNVGTVTVQIDDDDEGEPSPCSFMGVFMIAGLFLISLMLTAAPRKS